MKIDVEKLVGAVRREVTRREYKGQPARSVIATRTYDTTVEDLWNALTTRERIEKWLTPVEGELRLGGRYQLKGNAGGEVTACEPPRHLAVTWEYGGEMSWVEVTLARDGDRAHLVLEHIAPDVEHPHWKQFGPGAVGVGWDLALLGLEIHVTTGGKAQPEGPDAPPELKQLMRRASDEWGRAAIAFGDPEDEARAQAARTAAAYTGEA